jgi:hypothetical protein
MTMRHAYVSFACLEDALVYNNEVGNIPSKYMQEVSGHSMGDLKRANEDFGALVIRTYLTIKNVARDDGWFESRTWSVVCRPMEADTVPKARRFS